jgi:hypothetical protein
MPNATVELQDIYIQTRRPHGKDPGATEWAKFAVVDNGAAVQLYSTQGRSWGPKFKRAIPESFTARETAALILRTKVGQRNSDFSRKLIYPKGY